MSNRKSTIPSAVNANHTKSGPGRKHQHCRLIYNADADKYSKKEPRQRLKPATGRMNFKGRVVMSYAERDLQNRLGFDYVPTPIAGAVA